LIAALSVSPLASSVHHFRFRDRLLQVQRGAVAEAEWRAALRTICDDAHADEVPPEQLLVELR